MPNTRLLTGLMHLDTQVGVSLSLASRKFSVTGLRYHLASFGSFCGSLVLLESIEGKWMGGRGKVVS